MTIEIVSKTAYRINGVLIDLTMLRYKKGILVAGNDTVHRVAGLLGYLVNVSHILDTADGIQWAEENKERILEHYKALEILLQNPHIKQVDKSK
jgi:hypothetical protein